MIAFPDKSSVIDIPNAFAIGSNKDISGYPLAVSHFETALSETFNIVANSLCVRLFFSRSSLITAPVTY